MMKGTNSACLSKTTHHPNMLGNQGSRVRLKAPLGCHMFYLKQLRELHAKLGEEQQWHNSYG